jgi:hypothetical protein
MMQRLAFMLGLGLLGGVGQCGDPGGTPDGGPDPTIDAAGADGPVLADASAGEPDADPGAPDAGVPFEGDPGADGPFAVYEQKVIVPFTAADVVATLYAPSKDGGATVATADGPFALVIVMHGFTTSHTAYAALSRHLATWGFVAVGIDFGDDGDHMRDALEAKATIDWALGPGTAVSGAVDGARIATAGHSLGGKIAFFTAVLDPRVRAVIGWDPVDAGGPPCFIDPNACNKWSIAPNSFAGDVGMMHNLQVATLVFAAPPGAFNPEEHNAKRFWEGTKAPGLWVLFPGGDHLRWPNGDPEQRISKRTGVAWLMHHLNGRSGLDPYFDGAVMQIDVVAGKVAVARK